MATYAFKALDLAGAPSKGEMEAGDKQAVAAQLRSKGLIVVDIEEQTPASAGDLLARFKRVEAGLALSDSLAKHPDVFNDLYVAMVQAGETGGILDNTLVRVAEQLEKDAALRRQIKAAMVYPSLIGGFAFVVLFALVAFLVPVFEKVFSDFGGELPAITKFTVWLSHLFTQRFYVLFGGAFLMVWAFRTWKKSETGRMQWDRLKL